MAYLTYLGAHAGGAGQDRPEGAGRGCEAGQEVANQSGLRRVPQVRRGRQRRARAGPEPRSARGCPRRRSRARCATRRRRCRPTRTCRRRSSTRWSIPVGAALGRVAPTLEQRPRGSGAVDVRPHRRPLRPHELGHVGRAAPSLARARGRARARSGPGGSALDVCCGTGDLALELKRRVGAGGRGRRASTSPRRCSSWRGPSRTTPGATVAYVHGNALELPFEDGEFDAATVGFGVRNVVDLERGIAEMARVVRPGGRVVILEITTPAAAAAELVLRASGSTASCRCSARVAGDQDAYTLPAGFGAALSARRGARRADDDAGLARRPLSAAGRRASSRSTPAPSRGASGHEHGRRAWSTRSAVRRGCRR